MKTIRRLPRLCSVLFAGSGLSLVLGATAFAGPDGKNVVTPRQYQEVQKPKRIVYYVRSTASAIPLPLEQLGGIPTTTVPMQVIGDPRISKRGP
jgi:uncharacterized protein YndB with AHSA1/START domain